MQHESHTTIGVLPALPSMLEFAVAVVTTIRGDEWNGNPPAARNFHQDPICWSFKPQARSAAVDWIHAHIEKWRRRSGKLARVVLIPADALFFDDGVAIQAN